MVIGHYRYSFLHTALSFNQGISSDKKHICAPLCCNNMMQTYCGLTACTSNSPGTVFFRFRAAKSNPNGLLGQILCHYLNQGRTL